MEHGQAAVRAFAPAAIGQQVAAEYAFEDRRRRLAARRRRPFRPRRTAFVALLQDALAEVEDVGLVPAAAVLKGPQHRLIVAHVPGRVWIAAHEGDVGARHWRPAVVRAIRRWSVNVPAAGLHGLAGFCRQPFLPLGQRRGRTVERHEIPGAGLIDQRLLGDIVEGGEFRHVEQAGELVAVQRSPLSTRVLERLEPVVLLVDLYGFGDDPIELGLGERLGDCLGGRCGQEEYEARRITHDDRGARRDAERMRRAW